VNEPARERSDRAEPVGGPASGVWTDEAPSERSEHWNEEGRRPVSRFGDEAGRTAPTSHRVLVVDDHALVAAGLVAALAGAGLSAVACEPAGAADVFDAAAALAADVVLLDLMLDGAGVSALDLIRPLGQLGARVVAFTGSHDRAVLGTAVEAGVVGILHKSEPFDHLVEGVRRAAAGETLLSESRRYELTDEVRRHRRDRDAALAPFAALTPREATVLARLMAGESAEAIAEVSFVGLATVRTQIRGVLTKLGVKSQLAAVAAAHRAGWSADRP
jgi:two-component system nitrate/nitrite response regulator NarL